MSERRLNIRISEEDYDKLRELGLVLRSPSDSATMRTLIRLHHHAERSAVAALRRVKAKNGGPKVRRGRTSR